MSDKVSRFRIEFKPPDGVTEAPFVTAYAPDTVEQINQAMDEIRMVRLENIHGEPYYVNPFRITIVIPEEVSVELK